MENNSQPPFHLGQRVVALESCICDITNHVFFKKGQQFIVNNLYKCCVWNVNVGIKLDQPRCCYGCGEMWYSETWFDSRFFAPYNPPRQVEIAGDILKMGIVEERADVAPERVLND